MKLLFAGDFCPFDSVKPDFSPAFGELFRSADYSFVNLECPLTHSKDKILKCGPNIKASPSQVRILFELGVTGVTLANNHILDFGAAGVDDTLRVCGENGIAVVGVGADSRSASEPLILAKGEDRVAILNYAEREFNSAGLKTAGSNPLDVIHVLRDIAALKGKAGGIVIVIHGGQEHIACPSPDTVRTFRFLAEQNGVLAIIRHHPHIVQATEMWKGVPIFYSMGNCYFPMKQNYGEHWNRGLLAELAIDGSRVVGVRRIGVSVSAVADGRCRIDADAGERLTAACIDAEANAVQWHRLVAQRSENYRASLVLPSGLVGRILRKLKFHRIYDCDVFRARLMSNLLRCDAHLEVLKNSYNITNISEELQ